MTKKHAVIYSHGEKVELAEQILLDEYHKILNQLGFHTEISEDQLINQNNLDLQSNLTPPPNLTQNLDNAKNTGHINFGNETKIDSTRNKKTVFSFIKRIFSSKETKSAAEIAATEPKAIAIAETTSSNKSKVSAPLKMAFNCSVPAEVQIIYHTQANPPKTSASAISTAKLIITDSSYLKNEIQQKLKIQAHKIEVITPFYKKNSFFSKNRVERKKQALQNLVPTQDPSSSQFTIGHVTETQFKIEYYDMLFLAFQQIKSEQPCQLLIYDRAQIKNELDSLLQKYELAHCCTVLKSDIRPDDFYYCLDTLLQPTSACYFSQAVLEGLACGNPVITNKNSHSAELVRSKQLVAETSSVDFFTNALRELIANPDWRKSIAKQNAELALQFDEIQFHKRVYNAFMKAGLV